MSDVLYTPIPEEGFGKAKDSYSRSHAFTGVNGFFFAKNLIYATIRVMEKSFITINAEQTQELGRLLAQELRGGEIICLSGELGSGKTTFAQGVLKGLDAKGPYTSPTFLVMKHYKKENPNSKTQIPNKFKISKSQFQKKYQMLDTRYQIQNIYHIDAYRVGAKDILDLGWEEIIAGRNNIVIAEWAERTESIIPPRAIWLKFEHLKGNHRKLSLSSTLKLKVKA